jgi:hypothetical protein
MLLTRGGETHNDSMDILQRRMFETLLSNPREERGCRRVGVHLHAGAKAV